MLDSMKPFTIKGIIGQAWQLFVGHWGVLLGAIAILLTLNLAFGLATEQVGENSMGGFVITLFSMVVSVVIQLGLYRMWINLVRGKEARVDQMFSEYRLGFRYIGATIVYVAVVGVGLVLLIVPGVVWSIKYGMYGYAMVDRNLGVRDSLKLSATITSGAKLQILGLWLAMAGLMILSIIPIGLGLIATVPMSMIMSALLYDTLLTFSEKGTVASDVPPSVTPSSDAPAPFVPLGE